MRSAVELADSGTKRRTVGCSVVTLFLCVVNLPQLVDFRNLSLKLLKFLFARNCRRRVSKFCQQSLVFLHNFSVLVLTLFEANLGLRHAQLEVHLVGFDCIQTGHFVLDIRSREHADSSVGRAEGFSIHDFLDAIVQ